MIKHTSKSFFQRHWFGLMFFAGSVVALLLASLFYRDAQQRHKQAEANVQQAKLKVRHAQTQVDIFQQYQPRFEALQRNGFIGNNKRLQWLESLQLASSRYKIPYLDFTIEPSVTVDPVVAAYSHPLLLLETTQMDLKFQLQHEGDWYYLLNYLHHSAPGLFSVDACTLQRDSRPIAATNLHGLVGNCELQWYSLQDATTMTEAL